VKTKQRKWQYSTRAAAEEAARHCGREADVYRQVLNRVLIGDIRWFERGVWNVGLVWPTSATGGYAVLCWQGKDASPHFTAWYFDDLESRHNMDWALASSDPEARELFELIKQVRVERDRACE
jgi:hypothetical protein